MQKFAYDDYILKIARNFAYRLQEMETVHNFELGQEFESAICDVLESIIPRAYGITQGYVVDIEGNKAGDDVIIFDRFNSPTVNIRNQHTFSKKKYVPVETVYCYIEAKHTIHIQGDENDGQSLAKAIKQVARVKRVLWNRKILDRNHVTKNVRLGFTQLEPLEGHPDILNPPYAVIFARNVKINAAGKNIEDPDVIWGQITKSVGIDTSLKYVPDLIVLGENLIAIPAIDKPNGGLYAFPFYMVGKSLRPLHAKGYAFGVAIVVIMHALERITLGEIPWDRVIGDAFDKLRDLRED